MIQFRDVKEEQRVRDVAAYVTLLHCHNISLWLRAAISSDNYGKSG